ncbi:unnamed protein product [Linum trigynum]|uniref:Uncharacterized protein n=1 Tax=Linum trigynum TaxID=586398 RepID=A0AAV2ESV4_9ROSI
MLEGIRLYMMDRIVIKYNILIDTPNMLCPRIRKRVEKEKEVARLCVARQTLDAKCEVKMGDLGCIVDLNDKSCTYGYRQLSGLPCCHAVSTISHLMKEVDDYVHPCYHAHHVVGAYRVDIPCLDGIYAWPEVTGLPIHPPKQRVMLRRPKKKRLRGSQGGKATTKEWGCAPTIEAVNNTAIPNTRKKRVLHCSKCGSQTHNARTCPLNQGAGIQDVILNVGDRRTIEREMRVATTRVGLYVSEATGNQYVRLAGAHGHPVCGTQPTKMDIQGSHPPPTMQP